MFKVNNQKIIAFEKLFEMYNNFGLRHNNAKQYHLDMTNDKLEQWYDDIYTSSLFVILSLDEARILSELTFLREGWLNPTSEITFPSSKKRNPTWRISYLAAKNQIPHL